MAKNDKNTKKAKEGRSKMEKDYAELQKAMDKVSPELQKKAKELLGDFPDLIDRASKAEAIGTSVADLVGTGMDVYQDIKDGKDVKDIVKDKAGEVLENTVGTAVDQFLDKYANYEGELLNVSIDVSIGPFLGFINVDVGLGASIKAALKAERKGASITATGSISGKARLSVGISFGFNLGPVKCSIGFGIQGGPNLNTSASVTLAAAGSNLTGTVNPATMGLALEAELYFALPSAVPSEVVEFAANALSLGSDGNKITYSLGTLDVLTVTTPSYSISFSIKAGKFSNAKKNGEFKIELNDKIKTSIQKVVSSLQNAWKEIPQEILNKAIEVGEGIIDAGEEILEDIDDGIDVIEKEGGKILDKIEEGAKELYKDGKKLVEEGVEFVEKTAEEIEEGAKELYEDGKKLVKEGVEVIEKTAEEIEAAAKAAAEEVARKAKEARDYAAKQARWFKQQAEKKAKELADAALAAKEQLERELREAAAEVERLAREAAKKVEQTVDDLGEAAKDAYNHVEKKLEETYDTGRKIVSDVGDAIGSAASDAYNSAKKALSWRPW